MSVEAYEWGQPRTKQQIQASRNLFSMGRFDDDPPRRYTSDQRKTGQVCVKSEPPPNTAGAMIFTQVERINSSYAQVAARAGIDHSTLSRIVAGTRNMSVDTARKIADALDFEELERAQFLVLAASRFFDAPPSPKLARSMALLLVMDE